MFMSIFLSMSMPAYRSVSVSMSMPVHIETHLWINMCCVCTYRYMFVIYVTFTAHLTHRQTLTDERIAQAFSGAYTSPLPKDQFFLVGILIAASLQVVLRITCSAWRACDYVKYLNARIAYTHVCVCSHVRVPIIISFISTQGTHVRSSRAGSIRKTCRHVYMWSLDECIK
jgi:hypothetical protein